ncbi:acetylornithine transaminase [Propionimicrobium sp. PCR01-08-3]|uniref:acetylornithine transaminase n=1 Tax=Propionimicrobium sp. PCR01-08-3 TaxID=3052086 RepID=UPI00255CE977|nr:acetylornithine transaminase [Propionimicrobium sp. PCR01-08-3]WIY81494.1 acetylornithine transaminase [Propionimicrobium sp. PCR01-08-3]
MPTQTEWIKRYDHTMMHNFGKLKTVFVQGSGCYLQDADGNQYTDMFSGIAVGGLGHAHPAIVEAVTKQLSTLGHISNLFASEPQIELGERLADLATGGLIGKAARVYFANSGTEANEAAFKITRLTGRKKIVAMEGSFHGRTMGALALTSHAAYREPFEPLPGEVVFVPYGDLDAAAAAIDSDTAAVIVETIQGENGVVCPPEGFLSGLRQLASEQDALLWVDEVQTGIGRCGEWLTSVADGLDPDIITVAKGLGNGLPIAACIAIGPAGELFTPGSHGSTFAGNPVTAAAALAVLNTIVHEGLLAKAVDLGDQLVDAVMGLGLPQITEVRGRGLLRGVVLSSDIAPQVAQGMLDCGWIVNAPRPGVLRLAPPLIITPQIIGEFAQVLGTVVSNAAAA